MLLLPAANTVEAGSKGRPKATQEKNNKRFLQNMRSDFTHQY